MQHSIVARNVARTAARYVRPTTSSRERRLGIAPAAAQLAAPAHPAVFGREGLGPFVLLRARWREFCSTTPRRRSSGTVRHAARFAWSGGGRSAGRRAGAPATWAD